MLVHLSGHDFGSVIQAIYGNAFVRIALALVGADILSGVAVSLKNGEFRLAEVGNFLLSKAVPYFLGAGSLQLVLLAVPPEWSGVTGALADAVWLFVVAALVGHVLDNLRQIGLPVPAALGAKAKPETTATP
jgi:hypothetical protein